MIEVLVTLLMLVLLQAVLGFDNLLYISLESSRAPKDKQKFVRNTGILIAMILRIVMLIILLYIVDKTKASFASFDYGWFKASLSIHSLIVLGGGVFIIYTAIKEIFHMITFETIDASEIKPKSVKSTIIMIVIMNCVFSFDSILSAMALTDNAYIMATAIVIGALLMIVLADTVSEFLKKNRLYEVLGLFVLFIVGIMLITEGGEIAEISLFGNPIEKMSKTTFYFVIVILVLIDIVQGRYQKKLMQEKGKNNT